MIRGEVVVVRGCARDGGTPAAAGIPRGRESLKKVKKHVREASTWTSQYHVACRGIARRGHCWSSGAIIATRNDLSPSIQRVTDCQFDITP